MPKINDGIKELLGTTPQIGMNIAQGMSPAKAAVSAIGASIFEKIIGPAGVMLGTFVGVSRALANMVRQADLFNRGMSQMRGFEQMQAKFETILKSVTMAKERMRELSAMTVRTPFKLDELANASRNLEVLTKGAWASKAALNALADASSATGADISDLSYSFGKLYSYLEHGRSIQNLAFQLQATGAVSGEFIDRLADLQASGAGFAQTWSAVTDELGKFRGAAANEMESLGGLQKRLEAMSEAMERSFGESFVVQEKNSIYASMKKIETITPVIRMIGRDVSAVTGVWKGFNAHLKSTVYDALNASKALTILYRGATIVGGALAAATATHVGGMIGGAVRSLRQNRADVARGVQSSSSGARSYLAKASSFTEASRLSFESANSALFAGDFVAAGLQASRGAYQRVRGYGSRLAAVGSAASAGARQRLVAEGVEGLAEGALARAGAKAGAQAIAVKATGDAFKVAKGAVGGFISSMMGVASAIPLWGKVAAAAVAVGSGIAIWVQRAREARRASEEMASAIKASTSAMQKQIDGITTVEERTAALTRAYENLYAAEARYNNAPKRDRKAAKQGLDEARQQIEQAAKSPVARQLGEDDMKALTARRYYEKYERPLEEAQAAGANASPEERYRAAVAIRKEHRKQLAEANGISEAQDRFNNSEQGSRYNDLKAKREAALGAATPEDAITNWEKAKNEAQERYKQMLRENPGLSRHKKRQRRRALNRELAGYDKEISALEYYQKPENSAAYETYRQNRAAAFDKPIREIEEEEVRNASRSGMHSIFRDTLAIEAERKRLGESTTEDEKSYHLGRITEMQANLRARDQSVQQMKGDTPAKLEQSDKNAIRDAALEVTLAANERAVEEAMLAAKRKGLDEEMTALEARVATARKELEYKREARTFDDESVRAAEQKVKMAEQERDIATAIRKDAEAMANRKLNDLKRSNAISANLAAGNMDAAAYEISEKKKADMEQELYDVRREVIERGGSVQDADKAVARRKSEMKEQMKADAYQKFFESGGNGTLGGQYQAEVGKRVAAGMDPEKAAREATAATLAANPGKDELDLAYERQKWDGSTTPDLSGIDQSVDMLNVRKSALEVAKTKDGKGDLATVLADLAKKIQDASAVLVMKEGGR